jgi:hypothetical protein
MFFDANAARRPNACLEGVASSMLALNRPDGFLKASRVVVGVRSESMSSASRCRVGDREGVRVCRLGGAIRGRAGEEKTGVSPMVVAVG